MHRCRRCGEENHDDAAFCVTCGLALGTPDGAVDDPYRKTSEQVDAPSFGETSPPVVPGSDSAEQPPAGVPTAVIPPVGGTADATTVRGEQPSDGRSTSVMVAALAVAIVVIVGGIAILLVSSSGGDEAVTTDVPDSVRSDTADAVTSVPAQDGSSLPTTSPAALPAPTQPTTPASTLPPTPAPTPPPGPSRGPGDLGLVQPILDEPCDGRFITFVGSAVGDEPYPDVVSNLLSRYPGSNYIWTRSCPSLRQEFRDGSDIYGVVFGPYPTQQEACEAVSFGPPDAYVRRISTIDPPDHTVEC
jgi:serine/threonine-protein kinase